MLDTCERLLVSNVLTTAVSSAPDMASSFLASRMIFHENTKVLSMNVAERFKQLASRVTEQMLHELDGTGVGANK